MTKEHETIMYYGYEARHAKLIEAAPELLEALEWLVFLKDNRPSDYEEQKPLAWGCARAAIKKAKGE